MANWQNFYFQGGTGFAFESVASYGIFCKEIPFVLVGKAKSPAKRTWLDEHGDDEYVSSSGLYMESYSMKVEFGCKKLTKSEADKYGYSYDTTVAYQFDVRNNVWDFIKKLRSLGMMTLYSKHTGIGRRNVRLESVDDNAKWKNENGEQWLVFDVEFKVNDPMTDIRLTRVDDNDVLVVVT